MTKPIKKVVLAYSGGLDTSIILKWLKQEYHCEVVTFTADIGQGEELEPARAKAELMGVKQIFIDDLREEFVRDYVFPMFRANALYEGVYLLGTSIARPLIAKRQIEIARQVGADAVCHGATGKGNDQVRFELSYYALQPDIHVIAPWREWKFKGRADMMDYAMQHQIPVEKKYHPPKIAKGDFDLPPAGGGSPASPLGTSPAGGGSNLPLQIRGGGDEAPYSMDANLLHISYEGKALEDPWVEPDTSMFRLTVNPEVAPDTPEYIEVEFERGDAVAVNGQKLSPANLLAELNRIGGRHGVGRLDLVENRYVGMKSRGVYETPGGAILHAAHRGIESITLDRGAMHLKEELMPRYAELVYFGYWFSPEREMLQSLIDKSQENVSGVVRLKLYKGSVSVVGRKSPTSLYSMAHVTFEADSVYNQRDAEGFIKLNALRLRLRHQGAK
jgi:argininosuccinate synthase